MDFHPLNKSRFAVTSRINGGRGSLARFHYCSRLHHCDERSKRFIFLVSAAGEKQVGKLVVSYKALASPQIEIKKSGKSPEFPCVYRLNTRKFFM
jgi:hypothetical protein